MKVRIMALIVIISVLFIFSPSFSEAQEQPDSWAVKEVTAAINAMLIPEDMQSRYRESITRGDFCRLIVNMIVKKMGKPIESILSEKALVINPSKFSDTNDSMILAANALGIVSGSAGKFNPKGSITRQDATVMLYRTALIFGITSREAEPVKFSDSSELSEYAKEPVAFITSLKDKTNGKTVMGSAGLNKFMPKGTYSREQAYITIIRLFNAATPTNAAKPIPNDALQYRYGLHVANNDRDHVRSKKIASGKQVVWERCMPGFANWQQIEPLKGQFNWSQIDAYVQSAQTMNIHLLFTVYPYTNWEQEISNPKLPYKDNNWGKDPANMMTLANRMGKPGDMEAYRTFLTKLVERYDGDGVNDMPGLLYQIKYWEVGNEPDVTAFFQGNAEDYLELLKESYATIKKADADAKVLVAAMPGLYTRKPGTKDWEVTEIMKFFDMGGVKYFDIMNIHILGKAKETRELLQKYNAGEKPIWITEPGKLSNINLDDMLKKIEDTEFSYGVERIFGIN